MKITKVQLQNFRCFSAYEQRIEEQLVVIRGDNGTGKSSLLEALYTAVFAKSFRTSDSNHLRTFGTEYFVVALTGTDQFNDTWNIRLTEKDKKKELTFNNKKVKTFKEIFQIIKVLSLSEEDLAIMAGAPEFRRTFIDRAIALQDPSYIEILQQHKKVLAQKNSLLKNGHAEASLFDLWTEKQDDLDRYIRDTRIRYLEKIVLQAKKLYEAFEGDTINLTPYYETAPMPDKEMRWQREKGSERTLWGSHKDDPSMLLNDQPARFFASRGQQKLIVTLLHLAQIQLLNNPCILLLDDFLTDLDPSKAKTILEIALQAGTQLFISTPERQNQSESFQTFPFQEILLSRE
ncbi:MAG: replication and repair protein RecF protein [candidate division TM6 bacterium GW2011_GWF2_43_17]|nr:MAG: replication and repair protein RecF protein [candidate division TM6 bacterium GW2011_GWF2_43_17]